MHPILFTIGGVSFYSYGFFMALAFLSTYAVLSFLRKKKNMVDKMLFEKLILVLLGGIVGAKIIYFALYSSQFQHWYEVFYIWKPGMVSFGGILGGLLTYILLFKKDIWKNLDLFAVAFLSGAALWRIGCFLAGDHPEIFSTAWYAINYQAPAVLFESILSFIGFVLAYIFYNKNIFKLSGTTFFFVWSWYGATRIFTDYYRDDPMIFGLKTGQFTGIIMLVMGLIGIAILRLSIKQKQFFKAQKNKKKKDRIDDIY